MNLEKAWNVYGEDFYSKTRLDWIPKIKSYKNYKNIKHTSIQFVFVLRKDVKEAAEETFEASRVFGSWSLREAVSRTEVQAEAASANIEAAASHPEDTAKIMNEGGYTKEQNAQWSRCNSLIYWKKMPSRTVIAKEEKSMLGFKTW